jgi:hypothetical protein
MVQYGVDKAFVKEYREYLEGRDAARGGDGREGRTSGTEHEPSAHRCSDPSTFCA